MLIETDINEKMAFKKAQKVKFLVIIIIRLL